MGKLYVGNSGSTPAIIKIEEVSKTKFGANIDTFLGDVDENGVLQKPTWTGALNFAGVKEIGYQGLWCAFYGNTRITSLDLSSLQTVGEQGLYYAFQYCRGMTSVYLSSLQTVGTGGLIYAFGGCSKLIAISFPSLTNVQTNSFGSASYTYAFANCTALTEIHFRADMQSTIEALDGYVDKWGARNATIYFDL